MYRVDDMYFHDFYFMGLPQAGLAGHDNFTDYSFIKITQMISHRADENKLKRHDEELRKRIIDRFDLNPSWIVSITREQYDKRRQILS